MRRQGLCMQRCNPEVIGNDAPPTYTALEPMAIMQRCARRRLTRNAFSCSVGDAKRYAARQLRHNFALRVWEINGFSFSRRASLLTT